MHRVAIQVLATALFVGSICHGQDADVIPFRVEQPNAEALSSVLAEVRQLRVRGQTAPAQVHLPDGVYRFRAPLRLDPEIVGAGLTLMAESPGKVVISGGIPLAQVDAGAAGPWRFSIPADVDLAVSPRAIVVDGTLIASARYPDEGYLRIDQSLPDRRSGFLVESGGLPAEFSLASGSCDLILLHDWSASRLPVSTWDPQSRELRTVGPIGCVAPHYAIDHFEPHPRYWLEGHQDFANRPGEWVVDRERREIVMTADPERTTPPAVILPVLTELVVAAGSETEPITSLVFDGMTFSESAFPMPAGGLAGAQATMHEPRTEDGRVSASGRPFLAAAVHLERADDCRFRRCRFVELCGTALSIGGRTRRCTVEDCEVRHVGGNGVNCGEDHSRQVDGRTWYQSAPDQVPQDHRISGCEIQEVGCVMPGAVAIWAGLNRRLEISGNHIHDCPYTGISIGWIWNDSPSPAGENRIRDNQIARVMQVLSDGGGIYTLGRQPDSVIERNLITDVPLNAGRAESNGMFLDEGTTGYTIRDNTIRRCERSPLRFHKAGQNVVEGNHWELNSADLPPVRFNNTPETNISIRNNEQLAVEPDISR